VIESLFSLPTSIAICSHLRQLTFGFRLWNPNRHNQGGDVGHTFEGSMSHNDPVLFDCTRLGDRPLREQMLALRYCSSQPNNKLA
jgi:hypothetical protein